MKKYKILAVTSRLMLDLLRALPPEEFEFIETGAKNAVDKLSAEGFDAVIIEFNSSLGPVTSKSLVKRLRKVNRQIVIILLLMDYENDWKVGLATRADECWEPEFNYDKIAYYIKYAIERKGRSVNGGLSKILHRNKIKLLGRRITQTTEGLDGILRDGRQISWSIYYDPAVNKDRVVICPSVTIGCGGGCLFCGTGGFRPLQRVLSQEEIISQVLHGLDSGLAFDARTKKIDINFTAEGDIRYNVDNCFQAIRALGKIEDLKLSFIVTTIGGLNMLKRFVTEYPDLRGLVTFYWSVHTLDSHLRQILIPGSKGDSLERLRDAFEMIAVLTNRNITVAWHLIREKNDSKKDVQAIKKFFGGRSFELKISPMEPESFTGDIVKGGSWEDVERFSGWLRDEGIPCRIRKIYGGRARSGCGKTAVSYERMHLAK